MSSCPHCGGDLTDLRSPFYEAPAGEEWIELVGYGDRYLVSTHGRLYSLVSRKLIRPHLSRRDQHRRPQMAWKLHRVNGDAGRRVECGPAICRSFGRSVGPGHTVRPRNGDDRDIRLENLMVVGVVSGREKVPDQVLSE